MLSPKYDHIVILALTPNIHIKVNLNPHTTRQKVQVVTTNGTLPLSSLTL